MTYNTFRENAIPILENAPHYSDRELANLYMERYKVKWLPDTVRRRFTDLRYELGLSVSASNSKAKILVFDVENAPVVATVWNTRVWNTSINASQLLSDTFMISWVAKWLNNDAIYSGLLTSKEAKKGNDKRITKDLWKLFDEADILVAHNGVKFDIPIVNSRFLYHKMQVPSPYRVVDTLKIAKQQFKNTYNSLSYIAKILGFEGKHDTEMQLWLDCMEGDEAQLQRMLDYNIQDVILLEQVYLELRKWSRSHPNINLYQETDYNCSHCGSSKLEQLKSEYATNTQRYYAYRCNDCGGISRKTTKNLMSIAR